MTIHDRAAPQASNATIGRRDDSESHGSSVFILDPRRDAAARVALEVYAAVTNDLDLADRLHESIQAAGGNPCCRWISSPASQTLRPGDVVRARWTSIPGRVAGRLVGACGQLWLKPDDQPPLVPVVDADGRLVPGVTDVERLEIPQWWQLVHAYLVDSRPARCPRTPRPADQVTAA